MALLELLALLRFDLELFGFCEPLLSLLLLDDLIEDISEGTWGSWCNVSKAFLTESFKTSLSDSFLDRTWSQISIEKSKR